MPVQPQPKLTKSTSTDPNVDPVACLFGPASPAAFATTDHLSAAANEAGLVVWREMVIVAVQLVIFVVVAAMGIDTAGTNASELLLVLLWPPRPCVCRVPHLATGDASTHSPRACSWMSPLALLRCQGILIISTKMILGWNSYVWCENLSACCPLITYVDILLFAVSLHCWDPVVLTFASLTLTARLASALGLMV